MNTERRRAVRIKKHLVIQYFKPGETDSWDMTESKDFSEYGISITATDKFEVGTTLRFRFRLPSDPLNWHEAVGKVIACQKNLQTSKDDSYIVRMEIVGLELKTRDLIKQYVAWFTDKTQ